MSENNSDNTIDKDNLQKNEQTQENSENESKDVVISKEELSQYVKKLQNEAKIGGRIQGVCISLLVVFFVVVIVVIASISSDVIIGSSNNGKVIDSKIEEKCEYLYKAINKYFLWDIDKEKVQESIYKGILDSLDDPYSVYYTKEEYSEMMETNSGQYSGIGAYISQNTENGELSISRPMPGSPAEKAGMLSGDVIIEVNGENVVGQDINLVVSKIKGKKGTTVDILVKREGESEAINISVIRDTIEVQMLESEMLEDNVGYIFIYSFERTTFNQFVTAYDKLKSEGMESLIIDLRDNPGGDLDVVVELADFILPEGKIVYTKDKNGKGETYTSDKRCIDIPLTVLVNRNSASASEILAGSIKDYKYGTLVGEKTFGKGIVQIVFGLRDGSGVKITESEYYLPNDECIHKVGISPDVEIELDVEKYRKEKYDNQKIKAWEIAKEKIDTKESTK